MESLTIGDERVAYEVQSINFEPRDLARVILPHSDALVI